MIHLSMAGQRVVLRIPSASWHPGANELAKEVAGATWRPNSTSWSYPLTMATLRGLRRVFGDELEPDAELLAWATAARAQERALRRLGARDDANLSRVPVLSPTLAVAMASRTYQRVGAAWGAQAVNFLLADEPGLGKTATALAALMEGDSWHGDHLVMATKSSLESTWGRQIKLWTPDAQYVAMPEGKVKREEALERYWELDDPRFLVVNPAMIRRKYGKWCKKCDLWVEDIKDEDWPIEHSIERGHNPKRSIKSEEWPDILNHEWESIILDESHKLLAAYNPANITQSVQGLLDMHANRKIALTGTPLRGAEKKIWGTLDWFGVKTGGYWGFINTYMEVAEGFFGKTVYGLDPDKAEAFGQLIDRHVLRRTRSEVRKDLPMGKREDVLVQMDAKHAEQYDEFERMGETRLVSGIVSGQGTLSELTRLKQLAFGLWQSGKGQQLVPTGVSPKMDWLVDFLDKRGVTGGKDEWFPEPGAAYKYVVGSHMTEVVDAVEFSLNKLGIKTIKITGGVTGARRTAAQDLFQSDDTEFRVMLVSTTAGGESIDLDAWCDEMVILDETWIADDQVQLEGRINNRSGRVSPRTWWYVRTEGTIEQKIADENFMQHNLQHKLLDGRRGVEVALHLVRSTYRKAA